MMPPVYHSAHLYTGGELLRRLPNQVGGGGVELVRDKPVSPGCSAPPPPALVRRPTQQPPTGQQAGYVMDQRRTILLSPPVS